MLRSLYVLLLLFVGTMAHTMAQECMGVALKKGSGFEMATFDGKGKPSGNLIYKITDVKSEGGKVIVTLEFEAFSKKGDSQMKNSYKMICDGNSTMIDAGSMINQDQLKSLESFQMKFTSTDIIYPGQLNVGQKLKDASIVGEGSSGPLNVTFGLSITDRKVESKENITVPAGSYDAFKVTSNMLMETKMGMGMKMEMSSISYRAPGILWDIKTESYRKGKLISRSELVKIY
ncbi:hypothetical protein CLV98_104237 [Dyadobacter jejuensis]|uniref:DUF3108 domain-containing protein n=1 Tax=Dyadobacter jejuensis TaxID=1082580 RepID=A0A316ALT4_9BACT|nr:hypothetical protein [Dyadobacter jejuensis]PWJ58378.1 hypothetical protein CLV98_104237 [Dyadobacter jejuensis]